MHSLPCAALGGCFDDASDSSPQTPPDDSPSRGPVVSQPSRAPKEPALKATAPCNNNNGSQGGQQELTSQQEEEGEEPEQEEAEGEESEWEEAEGEESEYPQIPRPQEYPQIPRPSIIRVTEDPSFRDPDLQDTWWARSDGREPEDGAFSEPCPPGLSLAPPRRVMAEPDYLEGPDELIRPKKLINPVKTSRNHQDLHRELLMNQKRGLAPQNKPELQKVLEKRKREQVLKAQREEQEAHKKRSDLEIELLKRQQKLEQLELDQQKIDEEQENTPEFVKMKSNLRRTRHEEDGEERTT